jgi:CheY-like chemotaxis protein
MISALYDSDGHLRGFAKVTQDLTDRRHMQDLERASRNVAEFIATLAHELRNPLAPIRTALDVMARMPAGDPGIESLRQTIERQAGQLTRIVEDMLDISRITRGSLAVEEAPIDMAEVVTRSVETAAPAVEAGRHRLEVDLPPVRVAVRGDGARLTQLLANLLNNAARYTPDPGTVSITLREEGGLAVVRVRDTGRGIDQQTMPRIFDMFVRGASAAERTSGGLGVGLALSRRIAELHGGTLEAASAGENKGAEFTLRLPLAPTAQVEKPQQPLAPQPDAGLPRRRILIVDDNVDAATTLDLLLRSLGHETSVAHNGMEALRLATEFRPQVVLLDIGMPGLDGYEVARRLRTMKKQGMRIVAITGWGQEADRQRSREAGFDLHLVKPVEPDELVRALRNGHTLH